MLRSSGRDTQCPHVCREKCEHSAQPACDGCPIYPHRSVARSHKYKRICKSIRQFIEDLSRFRLVRFDVPTTQNSRRSRLTRYLRKRGFGRLQNSVWITPDVLEEEMKTLSEGKANVGSMILLDARPCAGESDADIVTSAWNFERINLRYKQHLKVLDERPKATLRNEEAAKALLNWATLERTAWLRAVQSDPLLPERILPLDYVGRSAWKRRIEVLRAASQHLQTFSH